MTERMLKGAGTIGEELASGGPQNPVTLMARMPSTASPRRPSIADIRAGETGPSASVAFRASRRRRRSPRP